VRFRRTSKVGLALRTVVSVKRAMSSIMHAARWLPGVGLAVLHVAAGGVLGAQRPSGAGGVPEELAALQGYVVDSLHNRPLVGARVTIDGTSRATVTTANGHYRIDSVPPGIRRVFFSHPVLDTVGIRMATRPLSFVGGEMTTIDLAVPSSGQIVSLLCPAAVLRARGPGALVGFVRDAETGAPATGSKVQLVYQVINSLTLKKSSIVRETTVDSTGSYRICGLPTPVTAEVQVFRNGISSGEVETDIEQGSLGLRSFSVAAARAVMAATDSGAPLKKVYRGTARVAGTVVDKRGQPIAAARVTLLGSGIVAMSQATGDFVLDSLPAGTQSLEVRKFGFGATVQAVELRSGTPAAVRVTMSDYVSTLPTVRVEAEVNKLTDIGYLKRKQTGLGFYMDGESLRTSAVRFSDAMRAAPGLTFVPATDGQNQVIKSSRDALGGCVTFVVDGTKFRELTPGEIDSYVRPSELRAIEVYNPTTVPAQFEDVGHTECTTIVIWTTLTTDHAAKK
jgi:hypothetical protein